MAFWNPFKPGNKNESKTVGLTGVGSVIAIASGKGGVGKSTVSANLAVALRYAGATVGLLDGDIYGPSQTGMLGAEAGKGGKTTSEGHLIPADRHGVSFISMGMLMPSDGPIVWRAPMATKAIQQFLTQVQWGTLDHLLIDLPPGTGDVQLTLAQQAQLAGAVIVTTPQEVALGIAKRGLKMFEQLNVPILGIIENMSAFTCGHCGEQTAVFKEGGGERMARELGVPFLGSIPLDPEIMLSGDEGVPVLERKADSHAAHAFVRIAAAVNRELARVRSAGTPGLEPRSFAMESPESLRMSWQDGRESVFDPYTLRVNCGCAHCIDENTGKRVLDPARVPADISFRGVRAVGRYAVAIEFSDGHSTGIYPFKSLLQLEGKSEARPKPAAAAATPSPAAAPSSGLEARVREVLDKHVNPGVASHGGRIDLVELRGTTVYVRMSGGCQGCSSARLTLGQGVERALRGAIPEITGLVDLTDHGAGTNPFYR